ncbi:LLM class F420-dependent oxidoreductase [Geodermatophilus obscurus]|uniref:Putative F420-dependent oxidoreductase n=1 Tax=Geodermatophilus obscurus (strain ATCC 25078 / DSM 43160 / JCM 3152 / CCUG 61914 / KCC A-0152 / KCTC 9177 / NBRC 13315 / NRRL B-3577 / G-20) TaxID=526225 RepID=D2SHB1_GEOOG|nr:LLM class F420-dependent oxidoreductase [Geodermatophilus obscurus]ADB77065.1 putative F420-dependent oxidoreductase [Geodermatophilus obscurus DSM 43160]
MRIGIQASYSGGFHQTAAEIRELESAGLDLATVAEVYTFDAVSQLGYLAAVTDRVELMSGIFPIYSRTPALTAMTAAGLDFVSDGRFTLGLGASGPQVIEGWHGVPYDAPLQRTREVVEICRQVWRRERLVHEGPKYTVPLPAEQGTGLGKPLKLINTPVRDRIPVMLAALGPKNVELAAEIAEAWEPIFFMPERAGSVWGDSLAAGKARRDPALGDLQIVVGVPVAIGDDVEPMLDLVRPQLALYIGGMGARGRNFYNDLARRYGYEDEARTIQDLYLDGKKDEAAAVVPEELVRAVSLVGPESHVAERVAAFREAGVTTLVLQPLDDSPESRLRTVETMKRLAG